jgi:hypothetical protein
MRHRRVDRAVRAPYNAPMRRPFWLLAALVLVALAAYVGIWAHLSRGLQAGLPDWAAARRAEGYDLSWQSVAVEGFPFALRLRFADAVLHAKKPLPYDAESPEIVASAAPWNLQSWHLAAPRGIALATPGEGTRLDAASLEGSLAAGAGATTDVTVSAQEVVGHGLAEGLQAGMLKAEFTIPPHAPESHRDTAFRLVAQVSQATLPPPVPPTAREIDTLSFSAMVRGRFPPGAFDSALVAWRDDGGTVELESCHLVWGKMTLDANGTLALDGAMQPTGALEATIQGADQMIDAVVEAGALEARYAGVAKAILRAIAGSEDADAKDALKIPITLQDSRLYIGPAMVASLPRIRWR